jgi:2-polyprenyl-6-methoxyphenol hydroxylase-like FAD-dependent oxidoreductase
VSLDPLVGQGANAASFSAWTLGEAILEGGPLDEALCRRVDERRLPLVLGAYHWTNFMTQPEPHLFSIVGAMSQVPALSDDFTENFNHPDLQWEHVSSEEAATAYVGRFLGA